MEELRNNWNRLLNSADLTAEERTEAVRLFNERVAKVPGMESEFQLFSFAAGFASARLLIPTGQVLLPGDR